MKHLPIYIAACFVFLGHAAAADPIKTFQTACMANAGDVAAIEATIKRAGFKVQELAPGSFIGARKSSDETVQVNVFTKHKFECAVTTSDMKNPKDVSKTFFETLGLKPRRGKATGRIGGKKYTFLHDTNGGEAFVMYAN